MNEKRLDNRVVRAVSSALLCVGVIAITAELNADEIVHKFKNPSFSGVGTGAHYLTIENQEHARKKAIQDALEAARKAAEREADNSTLAKFIRNLESRIYAQMAKQLVESMFSNDNPVRFGSFTLEGNVVTYEVITNADGTEFIRMTIVSSDGTETVIEIPIGTGSFGSDGDSGGDS
jgi:aminopeptidase N|tara:strand:+ start:5012 stop:5542 length:531 start_codon:yes stop_codon:yes gene_type:complete